MQSDETVGGEQYDSGVGVASSPAPGEEEAGAGEPGQRTEKPALSAVEFAHQVSPA